MSGARFSRFGANSGHVRALGHLAFGKGNKTEEAYRAFLETLVACGDVVWFKFEALKLRLADNTFYTPDFVVQRATGHIEFHEVKGFWQDAGRIKIKVAADQYPLFKFIAAQPIPKGKGGGWKVESF